MSWATKVDKNCEDCGTLLVQLGFIVKDGHMFAAENVETGEVVPTKLLEGNNNATK